MTLDDYLTIWADWMQSDDGPADHRTVAIGFDNARTNFHVADDDPDVQADMREASYGPIVDACIESLAQHERLAVHHLYGFSRTVRATGTLAAIIFMDCRPRLEWLIGQRLPIDARSQQPA